MQQVIRAVKAGDWDAIRGARHRRRDRARTRRVRAAADRREAGSASALPGNTGLVALDTAVTPELAAEGTARDVVRVVQQARRDAGLSVSDRIRLVVGADGAVADAIRAHAGFVAAETLAVSLDVRPAGEVGADPQPAGDGLVRVAVTRETAPVTRETAAG